MLIGSLVMRRVLRVSIHSASCQSWPSSEATIEAVPGRSSIAKPYGSDFRIVVPALVRISYL